MSMMHAPLLVDTSVPISDKDLLQRQAGRLRTFEHSITFHHRLSVVVSLIAIGITIAICLMSKTISPDRKVFFVCILGVITIGLQIVSFFSKNDQSADLLISTLSQDISLLTLGLAIPYLS